MNKMIPAIKFPKEQSAPGVIVPSAADSDAAKFLPVRQIGEVATRLVHLDRQRDVEWEVVKEKFALACVCAFMQIELRAAHPISCDHDINVALNLIQKALEYKEHDLLSTFGRPPITEFRGWLSRYYCNPIVAYYHSVGENWSRQDEDRDALVLTIAINPIWKRVHSAYGDVFVTWMLRADPNLNDQSDRDELWHAAHLVTTQHHKFGRRFRLTLDHLRRWMGHQF